MMLSRPFAVSNSWPSSPRVLMKRIFVLGNAFRAGVKEEVERLLPLLKEHAQIVAVGAGRYPLRLRPDLRVPFRPGDHGGREGRRRPLGGTLPAGHRGGRVGAMTAPATRRRPVVAWVALVGVVVATGLGSRRFRPHLPAFVAAYAGDTLWALAAFLGIGLLLPRASTWRVALLAISFSVMIEVSQLYHAPWIDSVRGTTVGGLVLGFGFVRSDLACYAVGVGLGVLVEFGSSSAVRSDHATDHEPQEPT